MRFANHVQPGTRPAGPDPEWYQLYFVAVLEVDEWKALIEIARAGKAIEDRLQQLTSSAADNEREIQDLNSALIYLRLLLQNMDRESEKLPWH